MNLSINDEEIEKNYQRFQAFFSTLSCIRYDDILRLNDQTNLKEILSIFIEDLQSNIIEHRFTNLLAGKNQLFFSFSKKIKEFHFHLKLKDINHLIFLFFSWFNSSRSFDLCSTSIKNEKWKNFTFYWK